MKEYKIFLDDVFIGTTNFEFADVPMGVVYGKVSFINVENLYHFFKDYCDKNSIGYDFIEEENYIQTSEIRSLQINCENSYFKKTGASLNGFDDDFQIEIYNISHKIMKSEFLHHYYDYYGEID